MAVVELLYRDDHCLCLENHGKKLFPQVYLSIWQQHTLRACELRCVWGLHTL